jgi:phage baseplate assembly protein V
MAQDGDFQRMVGDIAREGVVVSVDHAAGNCRVQIGDILSGDLPWIERAAGTTRTWCPPSVGEQVTIMSPEADLERGYVSGSLFSDAHPAPWDNAHAVGIVFSDGAYISYDAAKGELVAVLPGSGTAVIEAKRGITLRGDVKIEGKLETTDDAAIGGKLETTDDATIGGKVAASGDVKAGSVSLQGHVHDKVQAGGAISGKPVA